MRPPTTLEHVWMDSEIDKKMTSAIVARGAQTIRDYQSRCFGCIGR